MSEEYQVELGRPSGKSGRLKMLDDQGKTTNATLFKVVNLLTGYETHVPGGVISRFLNEDYFVQEVGENKPGSASSEDPMAAAQQTVDQLIAEAEAKAKAILDAAKAKAKEIKKAVLPPESVPPTDSETPKE